MRPTLPTLFLPSSWLCFLLASALSLWIHHRRNVSTVSNDFPHVRHSSNQCSGGGSPLRRSMDNGHPRPSVSILPPDISVSLTDEPGPIDPPAPTSLLQVHRKRSKSLIDDERPSSPKGHPERNRLSLLIPDGVRTPTQNGRRASERRASKVERR